jgi:hypothetical protein
LLLIIVIVMTKISIHFQYYHARDNDHLKLKFRAWFGLIRYTLDVPLIKIDDDSPTIVVKEKVQKGAQEKQIQEDTKQYSADDLQNGINDWKKLLTHVFKLHKIIRMFLKKVSIKNLEWHSVIGIGDAAHTGMITGALWAAKGSLIGLISHYILLKEMPKIIITPHFQQVVSQTRLTCIIQFRVGHAMLAGVKLVKFWKGGLPHFKTKPLSVLSQDKTNQV